MVTKFMTSGPLKLGEPLIKLDTVDSTNNYAINLLRNENATEGTVILADFQSLGKGQGGNKWLSDKNQNLLFSIILKPDFLKASKQFYLSMCISNGVAGHVESVAGNAKIKWPNDLLLNNKKVAGILIENTIMKDMLSTSVAGIGLNVNQQQFPESLPEAVSLALATGKQYNLAGLLAGLLEQIENALEPLYRGNYATIRTFYLNRLYRLAEWARYSDEAGIFEGRINDVAESGELIIEKRIGKSFRYSFKELEFV